MRKEERKLASFRKYFKKLMHGNNTKGVKISLKLFTLNMGKELYIKILDEILSKMRKHNN